MLAVRTQAAIEKTYNEEQLPGFLAAIEAMLKQNKNGDGFFVGDEVNENITLFAARFYLSFANSEGGPKRLKSDSCEAESCFPGYRIIETTATGSDLFESIAHQLVAGTYNVRTPSHIIRSVLVSYVRENPAMTAEVTPEGLYRGLIIYVCTMMWHYTAALDVWLTDSCGS